MKKLIISMLVVFATTSIQQSLRGNNSEIKCDYFTFSFEVNYQYHSNQTYLFSTIYEFRSIYLTGERKVILKVEDHKPTLATATIKIESPNGFDFIGPYEIEEGQEYEYIVPDESWIVTIVEISDQAEITYSYK